MSRHLDIVVAMVAGESIRRRTTQCLFDMMAYSGARISNFDAIVHMKADSILARGRHELLASAVKDRRTHLLFVDSDQTFPPHTLERLLSWRKEVVACNIATKKFPSGPTARVFDGTPGGKPLFTTGDNEGLQRVWRVGTGIMLIDVQGISHIPKPYFLDTWKAEAEAFQGEDWYFCEKLDAFGIKVYVDHGLSWQVGHLGDCEYTHEMTLVGGRYQCVGADGTMKEAPVEVKNEAPALVIAG